MTPVTGASWPYYSQGFRSCSEGCGLGGLTLPAPAAGFPGLVGKRQPARLKAQEISAHRPGLAGGGEPGRGDSGVTAGAKSGPLLTGRHRETGAPAFQS